MNRDAIYLSKASVFSLFSKYFFPTLFGMVSMSAVTAIDGIFVGHGVCSDGIAAVNFCVPVLMLLTGVVFLVPSFLLMPRIAGTHGIWLALSVSELLTFAVLLLYLTVTRHRKQIH